MTNTLGGTEIARLSEKSVLDGSSYIKVDLWTRKSLQNLPNYYKLILIAVYTDSGVPCNSKIPPFSGSRFLTPSLQEYLECFGEQFSR